MEKRVFDNIFSQSYSFEIFFHFLQLHLNSFLFYFQKILFYFLLLQILFYLFIYYKFCILLNHHLSCNFYKFLVFFILNKFVIFL